METLLTIAVAIFVLYVISKSLRSSSSKSPTPSSTALTQHRDQISTRQKPERVPKKIYDELDLAKIEINEEFKLALDLIEVRNENTYVTGNAGTGKSTFLKYLRATTKKNVVVLAPTGVAAVNVDGQTIHSFFRFPPKLIRLNEIRRSRNAVLYQKLDTVIIDEVSMVRADLMDGIDYSLRVNRRKMDVPFGGVQMIFFGDLFQLPPVVKGKELEDYFNEVYAGPYFFSSKAFRNFSVKCIELKKNYRQSDEAFIKMLENVRNNNVNSDLLEALNSRVDPNLEVSSQGDYVTLTTTNQAAYEINEACLDAIDEKEYEYNADIKGKFEESDFPTEATLRLKKGARIMLLRNDPSKRWVNGTLAKVSTLGNGRITVNIGGSEYDINNEIWKKLEYYYDREEQKIEERVIGTFEQYPIRLAWAITIHKSQGQTFEKVYIDLGSGAFAHGQTYVALSRCKTLDGIKLKRPVQRRDIIFDPRVCEYSKVFTKSNILGSSPPESIRKCILIVDDDEVIRNMMAGTLSELGYEVIVAKDGEEGLRLLRQESENIDIVITDCKHPNIDGITMSKMMKKDYPQLPIIMATGYGIALDRSKLEGIFFDVIPKPFRIDALHKIIKSALGIKKNE